MTKRLLLPVAAIAGLLVPAGVAHGVTNTYDVAASTSPTKAGTKKRPVPVAIRFAYTVGERDGLRPSPVKRYRIFFRGLRVRHSGFRRCSFTRVSRDNSDRRCSRAARIGTGGVNTIIGDTNNPADQALRCFLTLRIYNAGPRRAVLFLSGGPTRPRPCVTEIAVPILGKFIHKDGGVYLQFDVPQSLLHPIAALDSSVVTVSASLPRKTRRARGGRRQGYFESRGGCSRNRRRVSVRFTDEQNNNVTKATNARCRRR